MVLRPMVQSGFESWVKEAELEMFKFSLVVTRMVTIRNENIGGTSLAWCHGGKAWEAMLWWSGPVQRTEECLLLWHTEGKNQKQKKKTKMTCWQCGWRVCVISIIAYRICWRSKGLLKSELPYRHKWKCIPWINTIPSSDFNLKIKSEGNSKAEQWVWLKKGLKVWQLLLGYLHISSTFH